MYGCGKWEMMGNVEAERKCGSYREAAGAEKLCLPLCCSAFLHPLPGGTAGVSWSCGL